MTPKVLTFILDDETNIAEFFQQILNRDGIYDVHGFTDPSEFQSALSNEVNLVLLDVNIPGYDYDINRMITFLHENYPGIHIIVISGYLSLERVLSFWRNGASDAIDKNTQTWEKDLDKALSRVLPKIQIKLNALAK